MLSRAVISFVSNKLIVDSSCLDPRSGIQSLLTYIFFGVVFACSCSANTYFNLTSCLNRVIVWVMADLEGRGSCTQNFRPRPRRGPRPGELSVR